MYDWAAQVSGMLWSVCRAPRCGVGVRGPGVVWRGTHEDSWFPCCLLQLWCGPRCSRPGRLQLMSVSDKGMVSPICGERMVLRSSSPRLRVVGGAYGAFTGGDCVVCCGGQHIVRPHDSLQWGT